jgi:SAM-dependent methyltransferase
MRQGWDCQAPNWSRFARTPGHDHSHEQINLPALLGLLPPPGRQTLDLGCGEGRLGRILQPLGHRIVGIDASATMVGLAATHETPEPSVVADAAELPFPDGAFDLVVAYMTLHDMDRMPQAVAEIGRVLQPGGRLCMAIPHPLNTAGAFQARDAAAPFVISGSYLEPAPMTMTIDRGGIPMTFHSEHRPLESYARALEAAGMQIHAIREVGPSEAAVAADPAEGRWLRIPLFLHMLAVRPTTAG